MRAEFPQTEVLALHRRFPTIIDGLTVGEIAAPSLLPGWSRGHVLAHLTDAARARARVIEQALRGEEVPMWAPGERDAIIESTAQWSPGEHREAFAQSASRLEAVWDAVVDWDPYRGTVFTRWRELWIHLVDLDVGVDHTAWDDEFAGHVIDLFRQRLPAGYGLRAIDLDQRWGTGELVAGTSAELAAWLTGRSSPVTDGPELGPWPTY